MTHFHPFNLTAWLGSAETCVISIMSLSWMHFSLYHCTLVLFCNKNKSNVHISAPQNCNPLYHFHFLVHNQLILAQLWRNSCLIFPHRLPVFLMSFITASLKKMWLQLQCRRLQLTLTIANPYFWVSDSLLKFCSSSLITTWKLNSR